MWQTLKFDDQLTEEKKQSLLGLLKEYKQVFPPQTLKSQLGCRKQLSAVHAIESGDHTPMTQALGPLKRKENFETSKRYASMGLIMPSISEQAATVVLVPKKAVNGVAKGMRVTIDYSDLNKFTKKSVYPMPNIQSLLGLFVWEYSRFFDRLV